jgi:hypothetical protein
VPPVPLRDGAIIRALCALHHIGPYERAYRKRVFAAFDREYLR